MRQNPHVRICGGLGSATTLVYPTATDAATQEPAEEVSRVHGAASRARFGAPGSTVNDVRTCARRATTRSRSSSLTIRNSGRSTTCQGVAGWAARNPSVCLRSPLIPSLPQICFPVYRSLARKRRTVVAVQCVRRGGGVPSRSCAPRYASPRSRARTTRRYRRSLRPGPDQRGAGRQSKSRAEVAAEPRVAGASHSGHLTRHPSAWRAGVSPSGRRTVCSDRNRSTRAGTITRSTNGDELRVFRHAGPAYRSSSLSHRTPAWRLSNVPASAPNVSNSSRSSRPKNSHRFPTLQVPST